MYKMELKHMTNGIFQIGNEILDDKLKMLEDTEETIEEPADEFEYKTPQIFIDQLLRYRKVLSKVEISDEINTFLGAVSTNCWKKCMMNTLVSNFNPSLVFH